MTGAGRRRGVLDAATERTALPPSAPVRAIVFDRDGTLLHFTPEYEAVLAETFEHVARDVREEWVGADDRISFDPFGVASRTRPGRRSRRR